MTMFRYLLITVLLFVSGEVLSQSKKDLREKVFKNREVFSTDLDKAHAELDGLLKEAERLNDTASVLTILDRKCRYFYSKEDVNNLITASEQLKKKARLLDVHNAEAMSHVYLAEAYSMNGLFDKAILELDKGLDLLEKSGLKTTKDFLTKTNLLISQANVFNDKGEPREAVRRHLIAIKDYDRIRDQESIRLFQYVNYSNIASIYAQIDIDSAAYYVGKSMALQPKDIEEYSIPARNYFVLGQIHRKRKEPRVALKYFLAAYNLKSQSKETLDLDDLYTNISSLYQDLGQADSAAFYQAKLKEIEIASLESKYKSLHKVLNKKEEPQKQNPSLLLYALGLALPLGMLSWYFLKSKNKGIQPDIAATYDNLTLLASKNDPAYLAAFEKVFPDFSKKLLQLNPELSNSEIEFCSLLKLNLSTKKIAQVKFIEPRTVQNKKHRIRKRLDIPSTMDLYNWFNKL